MIGTERGKDRVYNQTPSGVYNDQAPRAARSIVPATVHERGREGGVTSGVVRKHRILDRVATLPIDARVLTAYKQGYDAGYHAALKRMKKATC